MSLSFRLSRLVATAFTAVAWSGVVGAQSGEPVQVTVEWVSTNDRCDFVLVKNDEGHGVLLKLSPVTLEPGDTLTGPFDRINVSGRAVKGNGDAAMMRGLKYGERRKVAVGAIEEWSRFCKPPKE
ncbi:MAG: hypothetical protein KIT73_10560 [Burkholderiales bacterium]|nr:hypothetical protein [Burkholderiales bacterium]